MSDQPDTDPPAKAGPDYPVRSADSVLRVLLMFEGRSFLRVSEVAEELGVARSTAHRLLAVLVHRGFATHDPRSRHYLPGELLWRLALAAVGTLDLQDRAMPHLEWLREATGETVHLMMLEGRQARFVAGLEARGPAPGPPRAPRPTPPRAASTCWHTSSPTRWPRSTAAASSA
jgi:IclR family transcriptional regulator, acetate operon repressor